MFDLFFGGFKHGNYTIPDNVERWKFLPPHNLDFRGIESLIIRKVT
jgi:hypothetical protein